jgi:hypothetical protein
VIIDCTETQIGNVKRAPRNRNTIMSSQTVFVNITANVLSPEQYKSRSGDINIFYEPKKTERLALPPSALQTVSTPSHLHISLSTAKQSTAL